MPLAPPRACPRCGALVHGDAACASCAARPKPAPLRYSQSSRAAGYTAQWDKYSLDWRADFPYCGQRHDGRFYAEHSRCARAGLKTLAKLVDHVVPIRQGGSMWDARNHQSLCAVCHNLKTARECLTTADPFPRRRRHL